MTPRVLWVLLSSACAPGPPPAGSPEPAPVVAPPPAPPTTPPVVSPPAEEPPVVPLQVLTAPPVPGKPPPPVPQLEQWQKQRPGAAWPPPGWVPPPCEVAVSTRAVRRGKTYTVTALAKNESTKPVTLSLPSRCPEGPVVFHGLGEGYDYYGSCAMGACAGPRDPERVSLAPGQTVELAAVEIDPAGAGCTVALPEGKHAVTFTVPFAGQVCVGTFASVEGRAVPKPSPPVKPTPRAACRPMPTCGLACPGGEFARDANGCPTCGCVERRGILQP